MSARFRRSSVILAALVASAALACDRPPSARPGAAADVEAEVRETIERYIRGVETGDTSAVRAAFVDDGRLAWLEGGDVRYRSVDAMLAALAGFPPDATLRTHLEDLTIVPVGSDAAHAWARFETTVSGPEGFSFAGALSLVLVRTAEGWRIVGGHSS